VAAPPAPLELQETQNSLTVQLLENVVALERGFAFGCVWLDALDEGEMAGFELVEEHFRVSLGFGASALELNAGCLGLDSVVGHRQAYLLAQVVQNH
jgi:hypothetical protein